MPDSLAPIALFVYNRPQHTKLTLEALSENHLADQSELIVFADGKKPDASDEEIKKIKEVKEIIKEKQWCKKVTIIESEKNLGLAQSIVNGVTKIVNEYGKIIVLEDDLITSPYFLSFMNEGLELYKEVSNVYSINGFMFPIETERNDTVLLPYTSTWGWATWAEKWLAFDFEMKQHAKILDNSYLETRFNLADYNYAKMLNYGNNSWGIRWYYSVFLRNGLNLFPTKSLVKNIGFDNSGINCGDHFFSQFFYEKKISPRFSIELDLHFYSKYLFFFKSKNPKKKWFQKS